MQKKKKTVQRGNANISARNNWTLTLFYKLLSFVLYFRQINNIILINTHKKKRERKITTTTTTKKHRAKTTMMEKATCKSIQLVPIQGTSKTVTAFYKLVCHMRNVPTAKQSGLLSYCGHGHQRSSPSCDTV